MNVGVLVALGVGAYLLYNMSQSTTQQAATIYGPSVQAVQAAQASGSSTAIINALAPPTGYVPCNPFGVVPYTDCKIFPGYGWYRP